MRGIPKKRVSLINAEEIVRDLHRVCTAHPGTIDLIGQELDQPYDTIYSYVTGKTRALPLDVLQAAHYITGSRVLERHLLWPGRVSVPVVPKAPPSLDPEHEAADVALAAADLLRQVREAARDERINEAEDQRLRDALEATRKELNDIEALLDRVRDMGGRLPVHPHD